MLLLLAQIALTLESFGPPQVYPLHEPLKHVQGIETDGLRLWVSSVDKEAHTGHLHLFEIKTGKLLKTVRVDSGELYHPGGISMEGNSLWVPVAEYKRVGTARIEERDKETLALRSHFTVEDHIGCVAVADGKLFGGNWDARQIYTWSLEGLQLAKRDNPEGTHYQDMKFRQGQLVASGVADKSGAIDWLDPQDLRLVKRISTGKTDRGILYTNEGMTVHDGKLYLLPEDGPSRLFVFKLGK